MQCKLCESEDVAVFFNDRARMYIHCATCGLIFVPDEDHVSVDEERERYTLHDNTMHNHGYVTYLNDVVCVLQQIKAAPVSVLDFGCGQNAILTNIICEHGYLCDPYDPLFGKELPSLSSIYDVVILCEVIEHFRGLKSEIHLIDRLLKHSGNIIIRTQLYKNLQTFKSWWYRQDCTHINFFSFKTIEYLSMLFNGKVKETRYRDIFVVSRVCNVQ